MAMFGRWDEDWDDDDDVVPMNFNYESSKKKKKKKAMPCFEPAGGCPVCPLPQKTTISRPSKKITKTRRKPKTIQRRSKKLEASLCAIISELEKKGIAGEVLRKASRGGQINLTRFWSEHQKKDEARLQQEFRKFSGHEQTLLKKMIATKKL